MTSGEGVGCGCLPCLASLRSPAGKAAAQVQACTAAAQPSPASPKLSGVFSLASRPDLKADQLKLFELFHDISPVYGMDFGLPVWICESDDWADHHYVLLDSDGHAIGQACSVAYADGADLGRPELPP